MARGKRWCGGGGTRLHCCGSRSPRGPIDHVPTAKEGGAVSGIAVRVRVSGVVAVFRPVVGLWQPVSLWRPTISLGGSPPTHVLPCCGRSPPDTSHAFDRQSTSCGMLHATRWLAAWQKGRNRNQPIITKLQTLKPLIARCFVASSTSLITVPTLSCTALLVSPCNSTFQVNEAHASVW